MVLCKRRRKGGAGALKLPPPQEWLRDNLDNIRLMGMEVRRELGIPDDTIGPLSPVMNALQFILFGLGKSPDEIERASDGRPTKRLGVWLQHHYPNGQRPPRARSAAPRQPTTPTMD